MTKNRFITVEEAIERVCLSRTHLYRLIKEGTFPKQIPLGPYKVAFLESEVDEWIEQRLDARQRGEGEEQRRLRALHSVSAK